MPTRPNVLIVMTDEERYPPPYESDAVAEFRRTQLPGRERIRARGVELHRHYDVRDRVHAESRVAVHRPVPVAARAHEHRRPREDRHRSRR